MTKRGNAKKIQLVLDALLPDAQARVLAAADAYDCVRIDGDLEAGEYRLQGRGMTQSFKKLLADGYLSSHPGKVKQWGKITEKGIRRLERHDRAKGILRAAVKDIPLETLERDLSPYYAP